MVGQEKMNELEEGIEQGTPLVVTYGHNDALNKPFEFLYEFGYLGPPGRIVVYIQGERNMQDSYSFKTNQLRVATAEDLREIPWGN